MKYHKFLLLPTIALIAALQSASATLVYQYEFFNNFDPSVSQQGAPGSSYIQFLTPSGSGGLESVYDFQLVSMEPYGGNLDTHGQPSLPPIPPTTFGLADIVRFQRTFEWDGVRLSGLWEMLFNFQNDLGWFYVNASEMVFLYPQIYALDERTNSGGWQFSGTRNVPDAGSTLAMLGMTLTMLGGCAHRLRVRQSNHVHETQ